jgi:hypothetical protein
MEVRVLAAVVNIIAIKLAFNEPLGSVSNARFVLTLSLFGVSMVLWNI